MPFVKSISIHTGVYKALKYILNPDKTEDLLYTSSMNCMTDAYNAYLNMKANYEHHSGQKYDAPLPAKGKGAVKAIHYIQSFNPKDNVPPELAHRIAKAFARKTFGDDVQVVIATHVDKKHTHNHIIINSYSMSGERFYANKKSLQRVREYSDRVSLALGINTECKEQANSHGITYNEWEHKKQGTSWKEKIRNDIDAQIPLVKNLDELLYELEMLGYEIKKGKYISLKAPGQQRFIRTKTLGEEYTPENLASRILWRDVGTNAPLQDYEPSHLRDAYISVIDQVTVLAKSNRKIQRKYNTALPYSPENDLDVYKLSAQLSIINRDHIHSIGELQGRIQSLEEKSESLRTQINTLTTEYESLFTLQQQAELFFTLSKKDELSSAEQVQIKMCQISMEHNQITTTEDLSYLKSVVMEKGNKIAALKEDFKSSRQLFDVYSDIDKTYSQITEQNYFASILKEQRTKHDYDNKPSKTM